jgi:hypothetical protein
MDMLIGIAHITGLLIALQLFTFVCSFLSNWEAEKDETQLREQLSTTLGLRLEDLEDESHSLKVQTLIAQKFNPELFKNRLSDICGGIRKAWILLSRIIAVGVLIAVLSSTYNDGIDNAIYAWLVLGVATFSLLVNILLSLACKRFTGLSPGQFKSRRMGEAGRMSPF